jgi:hypothetical protein
MDLILSAGEDWDVSGKRLSHTLSSFVFYVFDVYIYIYILGM